ncbi:hypothetical protein [Micromonospora sp. CNB394]|uniref:hypothetical protein n=1 Tax=Micromonospora sp. CNB394 TaxID=1169151 RepID=UPI000369F664|nr:hypothetical protein [Micromonospora sp. CNB394]
MALLGAGLAVLATPPLPVLLALAALPLPLLARRGTSAVPGGGPVSPPDVTGPPGRKGPIRGRSGQTWSPMFTRGAGARIRRNVIDRMIA